MHLFIQRLTGILYNLLYNKPGNRSVSLSSLSHPSKLIEPEEGVICTTT
jgi:hypothetical protein